MKEPYKTSTMALGFDLEINENLKFNGDISKAQTRLQEELTLKEYFLSIIKTMTNPVSILHKFFVDNFSYYQPPVHMNNIVNAEMNNVEAIDFVQRDVMKDNDGVLPRVFQEFPRVSDKYKTKVCNDKPWGNHGDPIYFDGW